MSGIGRISTSGRQLPDISSPYIEDFELVFGSDGTAYFGVYAAGTPNVTYGIACLPPGSLMVKQNCFESSQEQEPISPIVIGPDGDLYFVTMTNIGKVAPFGPSEQGRRRKP